MRLDRLNEMEKYILSNGTAAFDELVAKFDVSPNTIRRDLDELMKRQNIKKVYGGVSSVSDNALPPLRVRMVKNSVEKQKIGELAAELIHDNLTLFLDSGSTTPYILPYLARRTEITIVTHNLYAMYEAAKYPNLNIISLGGSYNHNTGSYLSLDTLKILENISVDIALISAMGISLKYGLTNTTFLETEVKRNVSKLSKQRVLMADHSKFNCSAPISFCSFDDLDVIVTDKVPPDEFIDAINKNDIKLITPQNS
jgi:DeoR family myo-inositol catabolism operon transcriptional repressor